MTTGKGKKRLRNIPVLHDEIKTKRTILLTPSAWMKIQALAKTRNTSASEVIEAWAQTLSDGS
jgi:hypothetical protein